MDEALILIFCVAALAVTALARQKGWPAPLLLVAVGTVASFIPAIPHIELGPEIILGLILPPLLFSAALQSSYQDFRTSLSSISRLGIGAVIVTAAAVAFLVHWLFPAIPFLAALVLGAVVAPPDAVSAVAVGKRLGLPRRVMTVLTGESLINDATSLTLYKIALAGVASGVWSLTSGLSTFALAVLVGVGLGLAIGWIAHRIRLALDDAPIAILISLIVPFACYWIAEALQGSGVLAVVAAGLYLGHHAPAASYSTRLQEAPIWQIMDLALEALTFSLIGLQLRWVIAGVQDSAQGLGHALAVSALVFGVVILVRPLYVFATARLDKVQLPGSSRSERSAMNWRESLVVGWAGMRGVVTLAAAAAIPVMADGQIFPERATVQLAAYLTAIGTLMLQGLTLPWLIRKLQLTSDEDLKSDAEQERRVRVLMAKAQAQAISKVIDKWSDKVGQDEAVRMAAKMRDRIVASNAAVGQIFRDETDTRPPRAMKRRARMIAQMRRELIAAQRHVLAQERDRGTVDEAVMRTLLREIDLAEESLSSSWISRATP
ncbi:monovalent cation:H+ antiporter, CPA1 family [Micrococcales bacterium KH10]|nr:monovalent cation:H+ antiporter, CPA1 family [Micrococcales bacterium KH10]